MTKYIEKENVTVNASYRLNFDAERHCGYIKVYYGSKVNFEEDFELYLELLDCGMNEKQVEERINKLISEIESGKIDVSI
ncbi:MAG: hypothetical protein ACYCR7_03695 [Thermoplasmataceae archaeon]|jgi:hypothetical protein